MKRLVIPFLIGASFAVSALESSEVVEKVIMGETEYLSVGLNGEKITYLSRIDTGARVTSLHAVDVEVEDAVEDMRANMGKTIHFTTINERGEEIRISTPITNVSTIRNAHGKERRYSVDVDVRFGDDVRNITVTLRDRTSMTNKLLIGRNWLRDFYLVDVSFDAHAHE